jgi:RimJ/RimL family protein N-acetyltransferase
MAEQPPLLRDIPDQFESERLIIRIPRPGDGAVVNEATLESLENLRPWMPWVDPVPTVEDSERVVRTGVANFIQRSDFMLLLFRKSDGLFVGGSGLHRIDWSVPRFEIGYWVRASLEGQGYVTEAVNRITSFTFAVLGAQRIEIRCDARNTRSAAVAQRAGYVQEALLRHERRGVYGELSDTLIFAKIAADGR